MFWEIDIFLPPRRAVATIPSVQNQRSPEPGLGVVGDGGGVEPKAKNSNNWRLCVHVRTLTFVGYSPQNS